MSNLFQSLFGFPAWSSPLGGQGGDLQQANKEAVNRFDDYYNQNGIILVNGEVIYNKPKEVLGEEELKLIREIADLEYKRMFNPPRYVEPWKLRFLRWLVRHL